MPMIDGKYVPKPWKPLKRPLFDLDDPSGYDAVDMEWYRALRSATALAVRRFVVEVSTNYHDRRKNGFFGVGLGRHLASTEMISVAFFEGELSSSTINDQLQRLVKTVGLVVHSTEPGQRENWAMTTRTITLEEAVSIVDDAFHGRYPKVVGSP